MRHFTLLAALLCLSIVSLSACQALATADPRVYYTQAAQTIVAQSTQAAMDTAVALLTQLAGKSSATPVYITLPPPLPTLTPRPSAVPTLAPSSTPLPCDTARLVRELSLLDRAEIVPQASFTKIWRLENSGECEWDAGYKLVFAGGDQLGGPDSLGLSQTVKPGEAIDITLPLVAAAAPGEYAGRWELRSPQGRIVQVLDEESASLWARIKVIAVPASTLLYDFTANACFASWSSRQGSLACPGSASDTAGSVVLLSDVNMESGLEERTALRLSPDAGVQGWISGEYPYYRIAAGDRFRAHVGCLRDRARCSLMFRLDYRTLSGALWNLGTWEESYDGRLGSVDVDLSPLAGETVQFILSVYNLGSVEDADGAWLAPRLEGAPTNAELVFTWRQQGGPRQVCQELKVFLISRGEAEVHAASCKDSGRDFGRMLLSTTDLTRVLDWLDRLEHFDGESFTPASGEPMLSFIVLYGHGLDIASNTDISEMQAFADRIYQFMTP